MSAAVSTTKVVLISGHLRFLNTKWSKFKKEAEEEQSILELFENTPCQQGVELHTRGTKTLDVGFILDCSFFAFRDEMFTHYSDRFDDKAVKFLLKVSKWRREANRRKVLMFR